MQREHAESLQFHLNSILTTRGREVSSLNTVLERPGLALDKINLYVPCEQRAEERLRLLRPSPFAWSSPHSIEITTVWLQGQRDADGL